jgi:hypothetical protein
MAIDFPNTPATNDTFTSAGTTFKYDGVKWNIVTTSATATVGDKGGVKYTWSSTTTDADPGAGNVRYNNATIGSVTFIYISNTDAGGNTQTTWYDTWDDSTATTEDGFITINENLGPQVNIFKITGAVTVAAGYYKIPVAYVSGTIPTNADTITIGFSRTGDTGPPPIATYVFSTTTTDADPGNGGLRYNNATIGSVTFLYIDNLDDLGNTSTGWYDSWDTSTSAIKGIITIKSVVGTTVNKFNLTGTVTVAAGYYKIPVTYISGTLPANGAQVMVSFASAGDQGESMITFAQTGVLSVFTGAIRYRFPFAATILGITSAVNTAPTGASLICDVNKNGTTVFTTQGNRPTIAASGTASHTGTSEAVPDVTAIAAGDYLTVDIDQVGSTVAGSNLSVFIRYKRA